MPWEIELLYCQFCALFILLPHTDIQRKIEKLTYNKQLLHAFIFLKLIHEYVAK